MMRAAIVLQARMGSCRRPGKSLATIGDRTMLAHCIGRLQASAELPVVVATTLDPLDDAIVAEAALLQTPVVRGSATDVLDRYLQAAATFALTHVVRATADNPAVDMAAPGRTLQLLHESGADYACESGLPLGAAVEAFTVSALRRAGTLATAHYDREHVTPYLRRGGVRTISADAPRHLRRPDVRLTVDTADDLEWVRDIHHALGPRSSPAHLTEIIAVADRLFGCDRRAGVAAR